MLPHGAVCFSGSQSYCPRVGSDVRASAGPFKPPPTTMVMHLYQHGVLVKHTLGLDLAVQTLNHIGPELPLLKAIGNSGSLKSVFWGLLFFS